MKIFRNIRAKVWGCVWIALLAYLLATLATSVTNIRICDSLTILEEVHFPLALKGEKAFTIFSEQTKNFESSLLTGEQDELVKAELFHNDIMDLLNEQIAIASSRNISSYPRLLALRDSYEDYYALAAEHYRLAASSPDPFSQTQQMLRIGKLRAALIAEFRTLAGDLTGTVSHELADNKARAADNSRLLQILFIAVLILVTLTINHIANSQLIRPLHHLKSMIDNFSRGKKITKPEICDERDEICRLALSFWEMSQELQKISVSKEYLDSIITYMSDSLIVLAPDLTITQINQPALQLLGYEEDDLLRQPIQHLFAPDSGPVRIIFEELSHGKSITNIEMTLLSRDNTPIPVLFSGTSFYAATGEIDGIICLARDIRQMKEELIRKAKTASYDPLTSLPNRNLMQDRLIHAIRMARRENKMVAVLLLHLENLSAIIETRGQESGDRIIVEVAGIIRATVRDTDTLARMKKDQFAVVFGSLSSREDGAMVATKITKQIFGQAARFTNEPIILRSAVALFPDDGASAQDLIEAASRLLASNQPAEE